MDILEKLAEKNKQHQHLINAERRPIQLIIINYLSFLVVVYFEVFTAESILSTGPLVAAALSFVFSIFLASFGSDLVVKHWLRLILLAGCHAWFCYYWIWIDDIKMAFIPLALILILWQKWFYWKTFKKLRDRL